MNLADRAYGNRINLHSYCTESYINQNHSESPVKGKRKSTSYNGLIRKGSIPWTVWRSIKSWKVNRRRNRSILRGGSPGSNPTPKNGARANGALKWLSGYRPRGLSEDCRTATSGPDQYRHRAEPGRWESKLDSRNKHSNLARRQSYSHLVL